jgi:hypothetical protein
MDEALRPRTDLARERQSRIARASEPGVSIVNQGEPTKGGDWLRYI